MTSIRQALSEAHHTGTFKLVGQRIRQWPRELLDIPALGTIIVTDCQVKTLPEWFGKLRVHTLDLSRNPIVEFPRVLLGLVYLRRLRMIGVRFRELPEDIDRLVNLTELVLTLSGLRSLPPAFRDLELLTDLDLGFNKLSEAKELPLPPDVERLVLAGNTLASVPESVRELHGLTLLNLSSVGGELDEALYKKYPEFLGAAGQISSYAAPSSRTRITSLPPWLFDLPRLEWLDLADQGLETLPDAIGRLPRLRGLNLAGNSLRHLPSALFERQTLKVLNVGENRLESLPRTITNLSGLSYLNLHGNELPLPPEILADATAVDRIWDYITRTREDRKPLDEAKLLVVGEGSVGKSSIIRRLTRGDFDPDERKTEGIDVTRWDLDVDGTDIAVNLWDFGGQEIMHATHQFFLTRRSVYLLVVDARQSEEQNRVEYWLKLIQGFSAGSPVILVGNKCEGFELDIDHRGLRTKYPDIIDIIETSCANNIGLDAVRDSLRRSLGTLPHVRDELPTSFFAVKEHLEKLDADYLPFTAYEELCRDKGVDTSPSQELLIGFLHDLGTVLCFRKDRRLRDTNILNPSWVTGGVYRLLNSHAAAQEKGLLTWPVIDGILDDARYQSDKRQFIVEMMKKFELCFESDDIFLIPDLLTKEEPDTGSWDGALHFIVRYGVLPSSIIGRLVVRLHRLISQGTVWRTGVVFAMDGNRALVKADREDSTLVIKVSGPAKGRRGLLTAIRAELRTIERTIPGLTGEGQVPVPGHPGVWVPYKHLLNLESAGRDVVVPQGLVDEFPIHELLDGVETKSDRVAALTAPLNLPDVKPPARFRVFGLPAFAGIIGLVALLASVVGVVFAVLSYQGDERERNAPDPAVSTPAPQRS